MIKKLNCKILALSLIFFITLQASSIVYSEVNQSEKPSYSIGDSWEYSVDDKRLMMTRSLTKSVVREATVEVSGNDYDCYVIELEGSGESSEMGITVKFTVEGEIYLQKSDLTIVEMKLEETEETEFGGETTYMITEKTNSTYDPPLNELNFPISDGKVWTVNTTETVKQKTVFDGIEPPETEETNEIFREYNVRIENVTVPAGTFEAFLINYTDTNGYSEYYYSSDVGYFVKIITYDGYGLIETEEELVNYTYAGSPPAPLDWQLILVIAIVVIGIVAISAILIMRRGKKPPGL